MPVVDPRPGRALWSGLLLFLALFLAISARAELPADVSLALQQAGIPDSQVAAVLHDLDDDEPILLHRPQQAMNPASVMKLVTTLAALDTLGPAHTFKTRVLLDGPLRDGVLEGNLILQGGGDPALTLERIWLLLRELRERGVREVRGDLILDGSHYALGPQDPAAFDQAPLYPYNAPVAALLLNFNAVYLRLNSDGTTVNARLDPVSAVPVLDNQLQATHGPCRITREQMLHSDSQLTLQGHYAAACGERTIALNLLAPEPTAAAWFRQLWANLGGRLHGTVRIADTPEEAQLLLEFESLPLAQLVRDTNKYSNNVIAKMLLLNLGAARYGAPATWDKGRRAIQSWLEERHLECGQLVLENGSGLSRDERMTAQFMARLLRWASRQPAWFEFAASLPAVGLEGTQRNRLTQSATRGQAWLKSGSLQGVRNLAGYVRTPEGRRRVVVFLINHERAEAGKLAQDALIEWASGVATALQGPE